ncbi:hypothetical protein ACFXKI_25950 [Streptomyces mirabilis]|uniref:hypothetical protein n=1 Tax=Streptomyces mirabilis TaxID=68239 RepID=UPI0036C4F5BF
MLVTAAHMLSAPPCGQPDHHKGVEVAMPEADETAFAAGLRRLRGTVTLRELGRRASCSKSIISDL